uniref:Uncharacterized protein n=1 Tax=Eutreptiella gymnastica TaxID=73025 RepID=A0A7S4GHI0_9EUGL|eukprot:CAMPEP_0174304436 /NCGR_PEP_ID=MMETSP0809-20121228/60791_1 /TAXON_ID=73025 ORGANISM="Eutreptiella gymnastica-like, Strain CCMP1594" /NCGR_SAMPLE_ID=MMETSP0809 /ASSEMBLY_ACC=CAM_ASM_000658 /LENGTH=184 /DNA_ID=CAMNT_0015410673 /DNA_START=41 /DNA_END=595 /DNA_ORIENTATION=-
MAGFARMPLIGMLILFALTLPEAKRLAPSHVAPVHDPSRGVVYVVKHWSSQHADAGRANGGYIEAHKSKSDGERLWYLRVYETRYTPGLERDVQDVFIKSMAMDAEHDRLVVEDERGVVYWVHLSDRTVTRASPERGGEGRPEPQTHMPGAGEGLRWVPARNALLVAAACGGLVVLLRWALVSN